MSKYRQNAVSAEMPEGVSLGKRKRYEKKWLIASGVVAAALLLTAMTAYFALFTAPQPNLSPEKTFVVSLGANDANTVKKLKDQGFIKSVFAFNLVRKVKGYGDIPSGGFNIPKNENVWMIAYELFKQEPDMKWIIIPEGLRKEEIGEKLAVEFNWTPEDLTDWNDKYTRMKYDYVEGVYFPDTYLIPTSEKNFEVAQRMTNRFNEKFAPYIDQFAKKDILWTTGLRLASVIQREAAGKEDMPLISGILWNRLMKEIPLEVDATVQYARGNAGSGWWAPISSEDKQIDSPYNTYLNKGLPPHPICNHGLDAIEAALNPVETDCLYYLHSSDHQIHCAKTYQEHQENISIFLQ